MSPVASPTGNLAAELDVEPGRRQPLAAPDRERDRPAERLRIAELGRRARSAAARRSRGRSAACRSRSRCARRRRASVAGPGSPGLPRPQHLRDRRRRPRLSSGTSGHGGRGERLAAEIDELAAEPQPVARAGGEVVERIDRDVDPVGDERRRHRRAVPVDQLDRARRRARPARGSSGSENTSRIVDVSNIGRNAVGSPTRAGALPLTATRVGAAERGRDDRGGEARAAARSPAGWSRSGSAPAARRARSSRPARAPAPGTRPSCRRR